MLYEYARDMVWSIVSRDISVAVVPKQTEKFRRLLSTYTLMAYKGHAIYIFQCDASIALIEAIESVLNIIFDHSSVHEQ